MSVFGGIVLVTGGGSTLVEVVVVDSGVGAARGRGAGFGRGGSVEVAGRIPAIVVKFEVVSALVPVIPAGDGGAPGALIVEVTPLV